MKALALLLCACMILPPAFGADDQAQTPPSSQCDDQAKPNKRSKFRVLKQIFKPKSVAGAVVSAGIGQGTNRPSEWGQGAEGYGKRVSNSLGKHLVKIAIAYPVAYIWHEQLGYQPSGKHGFGPRLGAALLATVMTRDTRNGARKISIHEIAGTFGSGLLSRLWQPASTASIGAGFASGGISLGADAGFNVVREFWPEIRHPKRHRQSAAAASVAPCVK